MKWLEVLSGYKTYLVAMAAVAYGLWMGSTGGMPWPDVVNYLLGGSGLAAMRAAVEKVGL